MGPPKLNNIFRALFLIQQWQNLTALNIRFLSSNPGARRLLTKKELERFFLFPAD
jgi:hypothetical protein